MYPWLNNFPTKFYVHCSSFANFFWSLNSTGSLSKIGPFCGNPASGKFEENGKITASLAIWNLTRKGNSETFVSADCIECWISFEVGQNSATNLHEIYAELSLWGHWFLSRGKSEKNSPFCCLNKLLLGQLDSEEGRCHRCNRSGW